MPTARPAPLDWRTIVLLILPPLLWAGNAIVGRLLVGLVPPLALNWWRWLLAGAVLSPFIVASLRRPGQWPHAPWPLMLLLGTLGIGAYNALQYLALQTSTPVNTTLIGASAPAWILAIGAIFFSARVNARQWAGAALSMVGVLLVLTRGHPAAVREVGFVIGDLYMLIATIAWAFYTWLLRKRRPDLPGLEFLGIQVVFGVMVATPVVGVEALASDVSMHWTPAVCAALAYIATGPSILAFVCWDRGVVRAGATLPIFFANLTPLFAAIFSALLLGEWPKGFHAWAFGLILLGIVLAMPRQSGR